MTAYYNEHDPLKAEVLREAIKAKAIAPGDVDERSICDVRGSDLRGYTQCHFFAGGGFWSLAGRLAGIPDDWPWWSGSCPCPSFSAAGKGGGFDDPRHLWPAWFRLIRECRPAVVFGEQADDAVGYGWLDLVQTDLEGEAYAVGKAILGAHSVPSETHDSLGRSLFGMVERRLSRARAHRFRDWWVASGFGDGVGFTPPHIRQRLYFVADQPDERWNGQVGWRGERHRLADGGFASDLGDSKSERLSLGDGQRMATARQPSSRPKRDVLTGGLDDAYGAGRGAGWLHHGADDRLDDRPASPVGGYWADAEWIPCRHPKIPGAIEWRPIKRGTFVLAARYPERVAELRLAGDAICVPTAQAFLTAYLAVRGMKWGKAMEQGS